MSRDITSILPRLVRLMPRLASDADGEVVATVRAIDRALRGAGCDWHDLTAALTPFRSARSSTTVGPQPHSQSQPQRRPHRPPQTWREIADWCAFAPQAGALPLTDLRFVVDLVRLRQRGGRPTEKQLERLRSIYETLGGVQ